MAQGYFITGTDTGIGKTRASVALLEYFKAQGKTVVGMKPIASGCEKTPAGLRNEDAVLLQQYSNIKLPYDSINPFAFELPVSPHIAAEKAGCRIDLATILTAYKKLENTADVVIVEGVGGWLVPLNASDDVADLAVTLNLPVIIVVGMRLGCINQARLTFAAIKQSGVECVGWIASCVEKDMLMLAENIATLESNSEYPLLAVLPYEEELSANSLPNKIAL